MREGKKSFGVVTAAATEKARAMAAAWLLGVAGSPIRPAEPNTALFLLLLKREKQTISFPVKQITS